MSNAIRGAGRPYLLPYIICKCGAFCPWKQWGISELKGLPSDAGRKELQKVEKRPVDSFSRWQLGHFIISLLFLRFCLDHFYHLCVSNYIMPALFLLVPDDLQKA
ncbi:hypothetical protein ACFLXU_01940 [Chloroflexota bacterium]